MSYLRWQYWEYLEKFFVFNFFTEMTRLVILNERGYGINKLSDGPDMLSKYKDSFKDRLKSS